MRRIAGLLMVVILLLASVPGVALAQDGGQDCPVQALDANGEHMIPWTISGTTEAMLDISRQLQTAALTLEGIEHVEFEWFDPPESQYRMAMVRIYYPQGWNVCEINYGIMWRLVDLFPQDWGHIAPYLPVEYRGTLAID